MSADAPRRLGRGLEALLATAKQQRSGTGEGSVAEAPTSDLKMIPVAEIASNHFQPRRTFRDEELAELEGSLRASGLLQPITVRRKENGWELVAGERRLRAATRLGWKEIPAIVRDFDDRAMLTLALVENLQRSDLNAIEEAEGYQRLIREFDLTQQQVAEAVGKDRSTITNLIRLLGLPTAIRQMVEQGNLSTGHARALLALRDERRQVSAAQETLARQWSVRALENHVRESVSETTKGKKPGSSERSGKAVASADPALRHIEELLRRRLQTDVSVQQTTADRGMVRISFFGAEDLERLLDLIVGKRSDFD